MTNAGRRGLRGWQIAAIIVGGLALAAVLLVLLVLRMTSGLVQSAYGFFTALRNDDLPAARRLLAQESAASTTDEELRQFARHASLASYARGHWSRRSVVNSAGTLDGELVSVTGGTVPVEVLLRNEQGHWLISSLRAPPSDGAESPLPEPPDAADQKRLVRSAEHLFADAVARGDFSVFRARSSGLWQGQISAAQLLQAFSSVVEQHPGLLALDTVEPRIASAKVADNGLLILEGDYPVTGGELRFTQKYIRELVDWKLAGIALKIVPQATSPGAP